MDVDLPTADLLTNLTNTSHFELPTAVLHGWLHSLMPTAFCHAEKKPHGYILPCLRHSAKRKQSLMAGYILSCLTAF